MECVQITFVGIQASSGKDDVN